MTQISKFRSRGFTLVEMMIVVAIIGILSAVAYPSYMSQVRKSRRSDAIQALALLQQAQERWRSNHPSYALSTEMTPLPSANPPGLGIVAATSGGYYTLSITGTSTGTAYAAQAVAVTTKSQNGDTGCSTLSITVSNGSVTNGQPDCWSK
jgi:type IV pilus assembly protein PilE